MLFHDRRDAGRTLAQRLAGFAGRRDLIVLALPRGGVPVGYEVARALDAPLDVFMVRKLGLPGFEELAIGAIASGDVKVLNADIIQGLGLSQSLVDRVSSEQQRELMRRVRAYRGDRPALDVRDKIVIVVDDGLATGASMRAAVTALRQLEPREVHVAVPVAAPATCDEFRDLVDGIVCARTPDPFYAVGAWYEDFSETNDDEVRELLGTTLAENSARLRGMA